MNRSTIALLLFILFLSWWVGISFWSYTQTQTPQPSPPHQKASSQPTTPEAYEAAFRETIEVSIESKKKDITLQALAEKEKNPELCRTLSNLNAREDCQISLTLLSAIETGSLESCAPLGDNAPICRDTILLRQATHRADPTLCRQIQNQSLRSQCQTTNDRLLLDTMVQKESVSTQSCARLDSSIRASCLEKIREWEDRKFFLLATEKKDIGICLEIENPLLKNQCRDTIRKYLALKDQDPSICESISIQSEAKKCQNEIQNLKDQANYKKALKEKDITLCYSIIRKELNYKCQDLLIIETVKATRTTSLCDRLTQDTLKPLCKNIQ